MTFKLKGLTTRAFWKYHLPALSKYQTSLNTVIHRNDHVGN